MCVYLWSSFVVLVPPVDFNLTLEALPNITQFSNLTTEQFNITQFEQLFTTLNATNSSAFETLANMTNVGIAIRKNTYS